MPHKKRSASRGRSRSRSRSKSHGRKASKSYPTGPKAKAKIKKVMHEFKEHTLETHGHPVKSREQAVAIALSSARHM